MVRGFQTTTIRQQRELTQQIWDFEAMEGELKGTTRRVALPSCVESYPGFEMYRGEVRFRTDFTVPDNGSDRIRLCFKGVSHTALVWLDGEFLGRHYNAYTPFAFTVKGMKAGSRHKLEVRSTNAYSEDSALHIPNDYESYGGITRPVLLETISDCYIEWVHVRPYRENGMWMAVTEVSVCNESEQSCETAVRVDIAGVIMQGEAVGIPAKDTAVITFNTEHTGVSSWCPDDPALYDVHAMLLTGGEASDDLIDRFGFRTVEVEDNRILLNGSPVYIKGFCRHEDHGMFGCAVPYEAMDYDLNLLLDLGANSVRTSHYPNDERFLDLCDEKGILVWEENHARGLSEDQMRNPLFEIQCEDCIREMITAHFNHPSIYIWGILNECANHTPFGAACYEKQFELIRQLDPYRPRVTASCRFKLDLTVHTPEVKAYNIYPEWYHDRSTEEFAEDLYLWLKEQCGGDVPFIVSEIGAGAIYGWRDNRRTKWSEDYQAQAIEKQIRGLFSLDCVNGLYLWQFCDTRVSEEWFGPRPRTMNNKGVVDEFRRRKLSYDVVKRLFKEHDGCRQLKSEEKTVNEDNRS